MITTTTKFHVYPDVSVNISEPVYKKKRKSLTVVIEYPDYHHHDFTGFFEVRVYDVDDHGKPKVLYFDTATECWADYIDNNDGPFGYTDFDAKKSDEEIL